MSRLNSDSLTTTDTSDELASADILQVVVFWVTSDSVRFLDFAVRSRQNDPKSACWRAATSQLWGIYRYHIFLQTVRPRFFAFARATKLNQCRNHLDCRIGLPLAADTSTQNRGPARTRCSRTRGTCCALLAGRTCVDRPGDWCSSFLWFPPVNFGW